MEVALFKAVFPEAFKDGMQVCGGAIQPYRYILSMSVCRAAPTVGRLGKIELIGEAVH
jgi:hypothetical protein